MSSPGLIGAGAGILFAAAIYFAMSIAWRKQMNDPNAAPDVRERFQNMWPILRIVLLADFVAMAIAGYFAGEAVGH